MPRKPRPPLQEADARRHRALISAKPVVSAYDHLRRSLSEAWLELRTLTGFIEGVAVWDDQNRYLFAWQVNPSHLLFYIRRPALDRQSDLHDLAVAMHPHERIRQNTKLETQVELRSLADAQMLTRWLLPELPIRLAQR